MPEWLPQLSKAIVKNPDNKGLKIKEMPARDFLKFYILPLIGHAVKLDEGGYGYAVAPHCMKCLKPLFSLRIS